MKVVKQRDSDKEKAAGPKEEEDIFSVMQQQGQKQTRRDLGQAEGGMMSPPRTSIRTPTAIRGTRVAPAAAE